MTIRAKQSLDYGLLALLGLALAISLAAHFLNTLPTWPVALLELGGVGLGLAYLSETYLIRPTMMHQPAKTRLILVTLSLALSTLFIAFDRPGSQPLAWIEAAGMQPGKPAVPFDQTAWGKQHTGFEIHATTDDDPQWLSQIETGLPPLISRFGGAVQVVLTQPEWAVFDEQGQVYQGGDGVEVRFVVERQGRREIVQQATLNLQARPEQRGWQRVEVPLPAGAQRLRIEAWAGSNNWYDRVWVSLERTEARVDHIIRLADWLSLGLLIYLSGALVIIFLKAPWPVKKCVLIFAVNVVPMLVVFYLGEIYLRSQGVRPYVRTTPGQHHQTFKFNGPIWAQSDPVLGWTAYKMEPDINSQGFRDPKDFDQIDLNSGKIRVMILGDSFIYGANVEANQNIPGLLHSKLKDQYEIFNLGVPGWGIDQMYLAFQQYHDIIKPDIVILAFIDDDVNRVLESYRGAEKMSKPSFVLKDGQLVPRSAISKSQLVLNRLMKKSIFFSFIMREIYLMQEARPMVSYIFRNIAQETQQNNEKFVALRIPTQDHANPINPNRYLNNFESMFAGTEVLYLEPAAEITQIPNWNNDFYLDDGHMNLAGNQFLADYIYRHVFENNGSKQLK